MKKFIPLVILLIVFQCTVNAQNDILPAQYHQVVSILNPSLTGMYDSLNLKTGYSRRQNSLEENAGLFYVNGEAVLHSKGASSAYQERKRMAYWNGNQGSKSGLNTKIAMGAFITGSNQGFFRTYSTGINTAVHVRIAKNTIIALGLSPRISNNRIDLSEITVRDPVNDQTYQSLIQNGASNTYFGLNSGLSLYASNFYFAYGADQLMSAQVSGNDDLNSQFEDRIIHHFIGSYTFEINSDFDLIPVAFIRLDSKFPTFYDITIKGSYKQNVWTGISYRSDDTFIGSLGLEIKNGIVLGYSYQLQTGTLNEFNNGSHELLLGYRI